MVSGLRSATWTVLTVLWGCGSYGQTGSGKSFTMFGKEKSDDPKLKVPLPLSPAAC